MQKFRHPVSFDLVVPSSPGALPSPASCQQIGEEMQTLLESLPWRKSTLIPTYSVSLESLLLGMPNCKRDLECTVELGAEEEEREEFGEHCVVSATAFT